MMTFFLTISQWAVPVLIFAVMMTAWRKKVPVYEVFVTGAMEGIKTAVKLTPYILAIFVAVGLFRLSGALHFLTSMLTWLGVPVDLITLGLLKPLSGSASLGITAEILQKHGPDSWAGIAASIIQGSSETTFYIVSLYLGSVSITEGRHILMTGLICEVAAFLLGLAIARSLA